MSAILLLLGFVAAVAVRDVWLGAAFGSLGLFEIASLAFGGAALVFGGGLLLFRRAQLRLLGRHWRLVLLANLTTGVAWLSYFAALDRAPPSAVNLLFSAVAPASVWLLATIGWARPADAQATPGQRAVHIGLLAVALALAGAAWVGAAGAGGLGADAGAGLALAGLAGVVITIESVVAKRMSEAGLTAVAVVGVRFVGVALFANVMLFQQAQAFAGLPLAAVAGQALVLLAVLVCPILLAQAGLARSTPLISSVVLALGPVASLTLQWIVGNARLPPLLLVAVATYTLLALAAALMLVMTGVAATATPVHRRIRSGS